MYRVVLAVVALLFALKAAYASEADLYCYNPSSKTFTACSAAVPLPTTAGGGTVTANQGTAGASPWPVKIDQTTPGTTNGVQVNAALPAGTNAIGTVQPGNTANTTPWLVQPVGQSTGGVSVLSKQVANNTTSFAVDASAGTLYGIYAQNNSGTIAYVKLYNAAQGSTTCGSGTPVDRYMIPASTSGAGFVMPLAVGVAYSTAITACVTTGFADSDATAPAANAYQISFYYK